jgi:hypothetical protein
MSLQIAANDPTSEQALAALAAAQQNYTAPSKSDSKSESASPPPIAPAEAQTEEAPPPELKPGDTPGAPATTESSPDGARTTEPEKPVEAEKPVDKAKSDYAKSEERKARSWNEVKAEQKAVRAEAEKVRLEKESFQREKLEWDKKRSESAKANVKPPEFYEEGAKTLDAKAKAAEDAADFDTAAELRVRAKDARALAKELRERKPDPTEQQTKEAFDAEQKKWTAKAGIDFPELAKKAKNRDGKEIDSPAMAKLKALITPGSDSYDQIVHEAVKTSPAGWYYAARLAHSETVAARVPTLDKELADSRAEVKKLNEKLSVNGGGLATTQPKPPDVRNEPLGSLEERLREQAKLQKLPR